MPLEVREIGIRFSVDPAAEEERGEEPREGCGGPARLGGRDRQNLVEECVRSVLDVLKRGRER
ncbi:MAG TPA: DUF5908 family protein [Allosphingosinicella sp.]|jgi:hypothetical protein